MGQPVSKIINDLDGQDEKKKQAEDALNSLVTLAEAKHALHYASVVNDPVDGRLLPIGKVISKMQLIDCGVSTSPDTLRTSIERSIKSFVKGETLDGLVAIASQVIDRFTFTVSANKSEHTDYAPIFLSLGRIGRIDFSMFYYKFNSETLSDITPDYLITSLAISSVDTAGLRPDDIRVLVQKKHDASLPGETHERRRARQEKILETLLANLNMK